MFACSFGAKGPVLEQNGIHWVDSYHASFHHVEFYRAKLQRWAPLLGFENEDRLADAYCDDLPKCTNEEVRAVLRKAAAGFLRDKIV